MQEHVYAGNGPYCGFKNGYALNACRRRGYLCQEENAPLVHRRGMCDELYLF